jgi:hypothetical protein
MEIGKGLENLPTKKPNIPPARLRQKTEANREKKEYLMNPTTLFAALFAVVLGVERLFACHHSPLPVAGGFRS